MSAAEAQNGGSHGPEAPEEPEQPEPVEQESEEDGGAPGEDEPEELYQTITSLDEIYEAFEQTHGSEETAYQALNEASYDINEEEGLIELDSEDEWEIIESKLEEDQSSEEEDTDESENRSISDYSKNGILATGAGSLGMLGGSQLYSWGLANSATAMVAGGVLGMAGAAAAGAGLAAVGYDIATGGIFSSDEPESYDDPLEDYRGEGYDVVLEVEPEDN